MPLYTLQLKTQRQVEIERSHISGVVTAINKMYNQIFDIEVRLDHITSHEGDLLIEEGEHILTLCITDQTSYFLHKGLQRFVHAFESHFHDVISKDMGIIQTSTFQDTVELLQTIFPFLQIKKAIQPQTSES